MYFSQFPPDVEPATEIFSRSDTRASVRSNTDLGDQVGDPAHPKGVGWG